MKRARLPVIILCSLIAFTVCATGLFRSYGWNAGRDYGKQSASKNFSYIFHRSLPVGVTNLKIVGRSYYFKQWFWMRSEANNFAMKDLLQNTNLQTTNPGNSSEFSTFAPSTLNDFDAIDKASVNWQDLKNIEQPEYYSWSTYNPNSTYFGYFIVDRKRHLIFAVGQLG